MTRRRITEGGPATRRRITEGRTRPLATGELALAAVAPVTMPTTHRGTTTVTRHVPSWASGRKALTGLLRAVEELAHVDDFAPHVVDGLRRTATRIEGTYQTQRRSDHPDSDMS